ncbi:hypothetical protein SELMODRAFT_424449 [Selaginella moellendorffii]|uniref:Cation-transporting P-type ATPase C-terminal domain-containing protein n=1 Tax=Selaginella moellendorffii TaxID=88036 RepID=D8SPX4_SELML|nr:hypothetical protein SELMODRAFT_424449 [Selaginella moellendorffii]
MGHCWNYVCIVYSVTAIMVAVLEAGSEHPLARAVLDYAYHYLVLGGSFASVENPGFQLGKEILRFESSTGGSCIVCAVSDPLKREAAIVVEGVKQMGIRTLMMTGDNWTTATAVAKKLGIKECMRQRASKGGMGPHQWGHHRKRVAACLTMDLTTFYLT